MHKGIEPDLSIPQTCLAATQVKTHRQPEICRLIRSSRDVPRRFSNAFSAEGRGALIEYAVLNGLASTLDRNEDLDGGVLSWLDKLVTRVSGVPQKGSPGSTT